MLSRYTYETDETAKQIAENFETAEIPPASKAMFPWVEKFVGRSWEMTPADIEAARIAGVTDGDIVDWALMAGLQTYFSINADVGGASSSDGVGSVVGRSFSWYENQIAGLTAGAPDSARETPPRSGDGGCWVETDPSADAFQPVAAEARDRWGFVPNLLLAVSRGREPDLSRRLTMGFTLLEEPQSESLSPRLHALVRALVMSLSRSDYSAATIRQQLLNAGGDDETYAKVTGDYQRYEWSAIDRLVLDFAAKVARNAYKVTADDAEAFRTGGLDDEAYVDVMCTVATQMGMDRMANSLGVAPDAQPLLAAERRAAKTGSS